MRFERKYFTQAEAQAKVGKTVKSRREFAGVPQGTLADVISTGPAGFAKPPFGQAAEVFDVAVQWHLLLPKPSAELVTTDAGETDVKVATLLGHTSLETTRIYSIPNEQDLVKAVEKLES